MTGIFLRVKRNGKWENHQVEHLTDAERTEILGRLSKSDLICWINAICKTITPVNIEVEFINQMEEKYGNEPPSKWSIEDGEEG